MANHSKDKIDVDENIQESTGPSIATGIVQENTVTTFERVAASRNTTDGSERCPIDDQLVCSDLLDDVLGLTKGSSVLVNDAPLPELTDQDLVSNGVIDTEDMELRSNDSEKSKKNTKTKSDRKFANHGAGSSSADSSTPIKNEDVDDEDGETEEHERSDRTHAAFHLPTNLNIREGNDYQCPVQDWAATEKAGDSMDVDEEPDPDVCLWSPNESISDEKIDDYCSVALGVYNIEQDRALYILQQCNYDFEKAKNELARRKIIKQPWNADDIAVFKQGIQTYGKRFRRIRQLLPHKTVKDLICFYYDNKKRLDLRSCVDAYIDEHGENISDSEEEIDAAECAKMCVCENCGWAVNEVKDTDGLKVCNTCSLYWRNHLRHRITNPAESEKNVGCPEGMEDLVDGFLDFVADECEHMTGASTSQAVDDDDIEILLPPTKRCENLLKNIMREQLQAKGECVRIEHKLRLQYSQILSEGIEQYRVSVPPSPPVAGRTRHPHIWTDNEKWKALYAFQRYGKDFETISSLIGTKTSDMVKSFYQEKQSAIDEMIAQANAYYAKLVEEHDFDKELEVKTKAEVVELE